MELGLSFKKRFLFGGVWLLLAFFILSAGGCAGKKNSIKAAREDYFEVLNRWTRSKKIYEELESRLYIYATYKAPDFRKAYIERYARSYQLEEGYRKTILEREEEQGERYNEIFIAAFTPDARWNDFDKKDSVWRLYLDDDKGRRLIPISVTRIDRTDPLIREFFPYFDLWSTGYIIRFPKYPDAGGEPIPSAGTKSLKLTVTGILGKGELEWRLKE